jgi:cysteine desulfurase/selenocysteine lyase
MSTSELAPGQGLAGAVAPLDGLGAPGESVAPPALPSGAAPESSHALGRMIERLANQYFSGVPGPALELGRHDVPGPLAVPGAPAPAPIAPPSGVFPAATSVGAGGFSPGAGWVPPTPGVLQSPPLASGPLPKESDLRTLPAMLSEGLGISSPVGLARGAEPSAEVLPYFMENLAGASGVDRGRAGAPGLSQVVAGAPAPGPVAPPSGVLPAAASLGAGGVSPTAGWVPPTPGVLQQPPLASGPPPKEADFRTAPATLSDGLGFSSPAALGRGGDADAAPYFMDIAGLPKAAAPGGNNPAPAADAPTAFAPTRGVSPGALASPSTLPSSSYPGHSYPGSVSHGTTFPNGISPNGGHSSPGYPSGASSGAAAPAVPGHGLPGYAPSSSSAVSPSAFSSGAPGNTYAPGASPGSVDKDAVPVDAALTSRPGHSPFVPAGGAPRTGQSAHPATAPGGATPGGSLYSPSEVSLLPFAFDTHGTSKGESRSDPKNARRMFDPVSVRNDFPILKERVHGREVVWFDNAATTQKPRAVIDRISYYYEHENSNIHRAAHTLAARATDAYEGARETVRRFLNAPSVGEIIFARGTTEAINLVSQSWGRRFLHSGDEVVISWLEHHANIVPWQLICNERGARLKVAPVDDDGQVLLYEYEKLLTSRTKFVSLSHVSNALGTIVPVTEMVEMAHRHGAKVLVDGAQAVSHMAVDVQAIDCDFYVFSGHKIFGPTGIGAVFGKTEVLESMPPWQGGGNMIRDVTFEKTQFQGPPARFEAGTPNIADAVGLGAALDYVSSLGIENISRYEHELLVYATERLVRLPGLRLYGTAPDKAGVLSFTMDGMKTEDIGVALDREGIAVRAGHHCAQPILRRFGQETTVRASLAPYNTYDDVDALVAALQRLRAMRY